MHAVDLVGVSKSFAQTGQGFSLPWRRPSKLALHPLDLRIAPGEMVGIIGPNGSGKSSLVRILSTLLYPDTGRAEVFGHDVMKHPELVRKNINRVSVEAAFFKVMSPWENMLYAARLYGADGRGLRGRVESVLGRLGLAREAFDRPMKQLSRGQQQKVAIGRSFLTAPSLLLMDEPTTGLDPRSKRDVQEVLTEMRAEREVTMLLCTHDLHEAEALCDRVILLDQGRLLADGTPAQLTDNGRQTFEEIFFKLTGKEYAEEEVVA